MDVFKPTLDAPGAHKRNVALPLVSNLAPKGIE
jgi:hypothetical protein